MGGRTKGTRIGNGAGQGDGWGGPAKGTPERKPTAPSFETGNTANTAPRNVSRAERADALKDRLYHLAHHAEREDTQVRAAEAWLNRAEGMPVSRNVTFNTDDISALDDDALSRRQEELERELRAGDGGDAPPRDPPKPGGVVH